MNLKLAILLLFMGLFFHNSLNAQAKINVERMLLETYNFSKPDPVPIVSENNKIAPYFKFYGYETASKPMEWTVVTLENEYIKVMVLPEIGGKVWGAIEKSTGNEFLYKNDVVKFRNIAMRGPWTSGGIEFNFGIIGHHPSTATPVNYKVQTNADGSVSCFVGNDDLPSNTHWEVEIKLGPDHAYFETHASWYNASALTEAYYNWMTGAAVAANDLEFFIPGNQYVEHNGNAHSWPIDEKGRNLALYKNNNFGPSKSYHIVGAYQNFFGGYYYDRQVGFGHWSPYEEMPGQKLWLWALSRSGGIWEDLLTDTDGQYIEFQAGRLLDQYSPGATNPIGQVGFAPHVQDNWSEFWFPVKAIGGISAVAHEGVLNVAYEDQKATIALNALQPINHLLEISLNGVVTAKHPIELRPMEVISKEIDFQPGDTLEVSLLNTGLSYSSNPEKYKLKRPFAPEAGLQVSQDQLDYQEAMEAMEFREYAAAHTLLTSLTERDPSHREGLVKLAELEFRSANYDTSLQWALKVLQMDTYHPQANYIAALNYAALGDQLNALESAGWAARDISLRSVAYDFMASIYLNQRQYEKALDYAQKSLDFNAHNLNALEIKLICHRKQRNEKAFADVLAHINQKKALHHLSAVESQLFGTSDPLLAPWDYLTNELRAETLLNLAIRYHELNLNEEAMAILGLEPQIPKNSVWMAYLLRHTNPTKARLLLKDVTEQSISMAFPYRRESIPVWEWAQLELPHWKFSYLLAQNEMAIGRKTKGLALLQAIGNAPDMESFYRFRARMEDQRPFGERKADYDRALSLGPNDWKIWEEAIQFFLSEGIYDEALSYSKKAYRKFGKNYSVGLAHAKALLNNQNFKETLNVLKVLNVLPYEHASESKFIYNEAHYGLILEAFQKKDIKAVGALLTSARQWPENLGVGKPFEVDERLEDYALALALDKAGDSEKSKTALQAILNYKDANDGYLGTNVLFNLLALDRLGEKDELEKERQAFLKAASSDSRTALGLQLYEKRGIPQSPENPIRATNANALMLYLAQQ
jgi:predicted Zn-dependent protease